MSQIPDYHQYKILIISGTGSGKLNPLLNLIRHQPDIEKIHQYARKLYEAKYQMIISRHRSVGLKHWNDLKTFSKYCGDIYDIYKNIDKYNPNEKTQNIDYIWWYDCWYV